LRSNAGFILIEMTKPPAYRQVDEIIVDLQRETRRGYLADYRQLTIIMLPVPGFDPFGLLRRHSTADFVIVARSQRVLVQTLPLDPGIDRQRRLIDSSAAVAGRQYMRQVTLQAI
jgi:hypothetical protein